ncbi:MAG: hypothetical protein LBR10_12505 [Prevotellaceae bacterium]|jgi:hypothetical protein|nr:hypothetical protein [Prevotellaceae bacterium]
MKSTLTSILVIVLILWSAQAIFSQDSSEKKKINILNSEHTQIVESDSGSIYRFNENVQMEHNGILMTCDSAILFPSGIFEAFGHAKVTAPTAVVTGDRMIYKDNQAVVSGKIVYLTDNSSTLRTTKVDFNTETEVGYFENSGTIVDSFRIVESQKGYYYSKTKEFEFIGRVQSDTKTQLLQSDSMKYNTETKLFTFYAHTHIWSENGYLYCDRGWYDSDKDIMFFYRNSYMLSAKQEIFADTIYYENKEQKGRMYSNIQVADTVQKTIAMADFADFNMKTEDFIMRKNPAIVIYDDKDTTFVRADTLYTITRYRNSNSSGQEENADTLSQNDSRKISAPLEDASDTAVRRLPKSRSKLSISPSIADSSQYQRKSVNKNTKVSVVADTVDFVKNAVADTIIADSVGFSTVSAVADTVDFVKNAVADTIIADSAGFSTVSAVADTVDAVKNAVADTVIADSAGFSTVSAVADTVDAVKNAAADTIIADSVGFSTVSAVADTVIADTTQLSDTDSIYKELFAFKNVKLFRKDFQIICDSLYFNDIDSICRLYNNPLLWEGKKMQIFSDSMKFILKNSDLDRAEFSGRAMIISPEGDPDSTVYFNQIKAKNMEAYFVNRRVRALHTMGNTQTLVFSIENLTMNKAEASSMKMTFDTLSGKVRRIGYYSDVVADNNPLFLVKEDQIHLQGFRWDINLRPKSGIEVLNRALRPSERNTRSAIPKPTFPITEKINEIEKTIIEQNVKEL